MDLTFFDLQTIREDYDTEFKSSEGKDSTGQLPKCIWETYSAMANTEGGIIFLGIKELRDGSFKAVGVQDYNKVLKDFWNGLNNGEKVSANLLKNSDVKVLKYEGIHIIQIQVPQASRKERPVYINGNPLRGTFRRNNDGDYRCSEEVVKQMLGDQTNDTRDAVLIEGFDMSHINLPTLQAYRHYFTARKPTHPFNKYNDQEFLRNLGGWSSTHNRQNECLTLAGLLMFGKLRSILDVVPNYIVDYQEQPSFPDKRRWIDRVTTDFTWSGNIYDFYQISINKLCEGLKIPFMLSKDRRIEDTPVHEALREALINILIHADYSGNCSLLAIKRKDLFEFRNPGLLRIPKEEALRGGVSDCRNRNLQKMFQLIGLREQAGSGFCKIYANWSEQHWKLPELEENFSSNQTILTLRMSSLLPKSIVSHLKKQLGKTFENCSQIERIALVTTKAEGCITHKHLTELNKEHPSELTKVLHGLVDKKILNSEGIGRGTFYYLKDEHPIKNSGILTLEPQAFSPKVLDISTQDSEHFEKLQKIAVQVTSSKKCSKELIRKTILELCQIQPLSLLEIALLLHRKEDNLRKCYISPLCAEGLLHREYPNITTHPKQRYFYKNFKS